MTDLLPCIISAVLVAASAALFAGAVVRGRTWRSWRSPFRPHAPPVGCPAPSPADGLPAAKPGDESFG